MEYAYHHARGVPTVTMSGRFVYADATKIHDIIADWDFAASPSITLDLKFVTFVDSTAMGMLFLLAARVRDAGGKLTLCGPSPSVIRTLQRAEIHSVADLTTSDGQIIAP